MREFQEGEIVLIDETAEFYAGDRQFVAAGEFLDFGEGHFQLFAVRGLRGRGFLRRAFGGHRHLVYGVAHRACRLARFPHLGFHLAERGLQLLGIGADIDNQFLNRHWRNLTRKKNPLLDHSSRGFRKNVLEDRYFFSAAIFSRRLMIRWFCADCSSCSLSAASCITSVDC